MTDLFTVVVENRQTGKVVRRSRRFWDGPRADRLRRAAERLYPSVRYDVCCSRAQAPGRWFVHLMERGPECCG